MIFIQRPSFLAILTLASSGLLTGCDRTLSIDVPDDEIRADYDINIHDGESSVILAEYYTFQTVTSGDTPKTSRFNMDIVDPDHVTATHNGTLYTFRAMEDVFNDLMTIPGFSMNPLSIIFDLIGAMSGHIQSTLIPDVTGGDQMTINLVREDNKTFAKTLQIHSLPIITSPLKNTVIPAAQETLSFSWQGIPSANDVKPYSIEFYGVYNMLYLSIDIDCAEPETSNMTMDAIVTKTNNDQQNSRLKEIYKYIPIANTSYSISRSELLSNVNPYPGLTRCEIRTTLSYNLKDTMTDVFAGGELNINHYSYENSVYLDL